MRAIDSLSLDRSAGEIVRELALHRLEEARAALEQVDDDGGSGGQRAFRSALRNLHALLEAYGVAALEAEDLEIALRGLRHILASSASGSDTEVQLRWMCQHLIARTPGAHEFRLELQRILEGLRSHEHSFMRERIVPLFLGLQRDLEATLGWTRGRVASPELAKESFARSSERQLAAAASTLESRLSVLDALPDGVAAEEARLAVGRLHALLDPLLGWMPGQEAEKRLGELDALLEELAILAGLRSLLRSMLERAAFERARARLAEVENGTGDGDPSARAQLLEDGCITAARSVAVRRSELGNSLSHDWLGGACRPFFALLNGVIQELQQPLEMRSLMQRAPVSRAEPEQAILEQAFERLFKGTSEVKGAEVVQKPAARRRVSALRAIRELDSAQSQPQSPEGPSASASETADHATPIAVHAQLESEGGVLGPAHTTATPEPVAAVAEPAAEPIALEVTAPTADTSEPAELLAAALTESDPVTLAEDPADVQESTADSGVESPAARLAGVYWNRFLKTSGVQPHHAAVVGASLVFALLTGGVLGGLAMESTGSTSPAKQAAPTQQRTAPQTKLESPSRDSWFSAVAVAAEPWLSSPTKVSRGR